jgi:peptide deformylase
MSSKIITIPEDEILLRTPSKVTTFQEVLEMKLFDRLQAANSKAWTGGVGLAAIQIGVALRVAFYKDPNTKAETPRFLINPEILFGRHLNLHGAEGCLSIPGKRFNVWRFHEIEYRKLVHGKMETATARGMEAVIIQHEVDHMNGVLCCDRISKPVVPGRNEACSCGSGKKYKKCCIEKGVVYV